MLNARRRFFSQIYTLLLICWGVLVLSACLATPRPTAAPAPTPMGKAASATPLKSAPLPALTPSPLPTYPAGYKPVRLAWFYKPPVSPSIDSLVKNFDLFILTKNDEDLRDELKKRGIQSKILQYLRFDAIMNPDSCNAQPYRNQVADQPGDFCRISQQNPNWFLVDRQNKPLESNDYVLMDPGQSGWRSFWLERARLSQENLKWEGVFLDNVELSFEKRQQTGLMPKNYSDEASYLAAIEGFIQYLSNNYFRPQKRPLYANLIANTQPERALRLLPYLDGVMIENFAVDWNNEYLSLSDWAQQMKLAREIQAAGKDVILVAQGKKSDLERQQFALASYLLTNEGRAYFRYTDSDSYEQIWMYDNYTAALGAPQGPMRQENTTWRRDFTQGSVWVDPAKHQSGIEVR